MSSDKAPYFRGIAHQSFCCRINLTTVRFVFAGFGSGHTGWKTSSSAMPAEPAKRQFLAISRSGRNLYQSLITWQSQILFCNLWRLG